VLPTFVDARIRTRALASLYLAGAAIGAVSLVLPHSADSNDLALWSNVLLAAAVGGVLFLARARLPVWAIQLLLAAGTLVITRAVLYSGEKVSFYSVWYIWIGLYAFYFLDRRSAAAQVAFAAAAFAVTLAVEPSSSPVARWLTTIATLVVAGVFIDTLVSRARRQAIAAEEARDGMATAAEVAHELGRLSDSAEARTAICRAAVRVTAADGVALWEPATDGTGLVLAATSGIEPEQRTLPFVGKPASATLAFSSGDVVFPAAGRETLERAPEFLGATIAPAAGIWQPVVRDTVPVAVLAFYWRDAHATAQDAPAALTSLLAGEAAATLERVALLARLEAMARTDDLTGLPNRRAWQEELPREVSRARRAENHLCVAMLDLDHFKRFNDERGHQAGDRFLKQAAGAWGAALRETDLLARYGGEEFALALPDCPPEKALRVIERIRAVTPGGETLSAGVAFWNGSESADDLLGRADAALYEAKARGRNQAIVVGR
jgi:diguanylate cyclase (GGDEF)-like protein